MLSCACSLSLPPLDVYLHAVAPRKSEPKEALFSMCNCFSTRPVWEEGSQVSRKRNRSSRRAIPRRMSCTFKKAV